MKVDNGVHEHIINDLIHSSREFHSFFGKKTKTRETSKTDFKPNISEGKSKRFVLIKKTQQYKRSHKVKRNKRKKEVECKAYVLFQ